MKVFIYDNPSIINLWFNEPDYRIPFLSTNLLNFNTMGLLKFSNEKRDSLKIFLPNYWDIDNHNYFHHYDGSSVKDTLDAHQTHDYELVFIMSAFSLLVGDLEESDVAHLKQNPDKLFSNRGIVGGFLKKGQELPTPEEYSGFISFVELRDSNYLKLSQELVGNLNFNTVKVAATTYGKPSNLSPNISPDSTICAPSFIGKDVVVNGSYVGAGSVLRGNTRLTNSRVFGSVLVDSTASNSTISDSVVSNSLLDNVTLSKSVVPFGGVINDTR